MKFAKLFVIAAVATVAFSSCGGGSSTEAVDSTAVVVDSTPVAPADTTAVAPADSTATDSAAVAQ